VAAAPVPQRIALVVHPVRQIDRAIATLTHWAAEHGVAVVQLATDGDRHREVADPGTLQAGDLVVAVGGDGTVLSAMRAAARASAPVLGVACGSLGALAAVPAEELADALRRVWAGDWTPRVVPALAIESPGAEHEWAVNDFVVVRRGAGQLVAELSVDDELYLRLAGDGLIVATALGSSAYSMAAGGPLLAAGTPGFVCTPIAMHGGSARPLVVPADATASIALHPGYAGFDIEIDGHDRPLQSLLFRLRLHPDKVALVAFTPAGRGLTALRTRGLVTDSPRVLARDERAQR
jgi:NAD+ kinase